MSKLGAAVVITGSQKALAVQPGISVITLSPAALKRIEENDEKCLYLSLKEALLNGERGQTPFTPAVTILLQINKRLNGIVDNGGIEKEREIIKIRAEYIRRSLGDFPFRLVASSPSSAVSAFYTESSAKELVRIMKDEYDIWICPNGGEYADKVFRIGHLGNITENDNKKLIEAFTDIKNRGLL